MEHNISKKLFTTVFIPTYKNFLYFTVNNSGFALNTVDALVEFTEKVRQHKQNRNKFFSWSL